MDIYLQLNLPFGLNLNLGLCLPNTCSAEEVIEHIETGLLQIMKLSILFAYYYVAAYHIQCALCIHDY